MDAIEFLQDLAVVLSIAALITILFHRYRQPVVLGYILAGVIIGPHTPPVQLISSVESIQTLSQLGVVMLMFSLGLEFSFRGLVRVGPTAGLAAALEIMLMIWLGYQVGYFFGWKHIDSVFLGCMLLSSSTVIIVKALSDLGLARERFARFAFGMLVIDDMAAIVAIAVLSGIALSGSMSPQELLLTGGKIGLFFIAVIVLGLLAMPRFLRYVASLRNDEVLVVAVLGIGFGMALLAVRLGFSTALGAFLIGAVIAETREAGRVRTLIEPVRDMFSAIFFVSIGMMLDPKLVIEHWLPVVVVALTLIVGKTITGALGSFVAGNDLRTSVRVGVSLAQIGEFAFIIATLGNSLGVTSDFLYPIGVSVSGITTLTTPFLIRHSDKLAAIIERAFPTALRRYMDVYQRWVSRLAGAPAHRTQVRRLVRRWAMQLLLNMALAVAIFVAASGMAVWLEPYLAVIPDWLGGPAAAMFVAALLVSLPLLVASFRKLRAAAMLMAELSIRHGKPENIAVARGIVVRIVVVGGSAIMVLLLLLVGSSILPSWPVLLGILAGVAGVAAWQWGAFIRLYSRGQVALVEVFETPPEATGSAEEPAPLPSILREAMLQSVTLDEASPATGRLIRELALRTRTGATIVGIERDAKPIISPSPDEELLAGDTIVLIGGEAQLTAARAVLLGTATPPPA